MDWILEHLQFLVVVGGLVAYWLNQRRSAPAPDEEASLPDRGEEFPPAREERPVLVPDELRRRILEQLGIPQEPIEPPRPAPPLPIVVSPPPIPVPAAVTMPPPPRKKEMVPAKKTTSRGRVIRNALRSPGKVRQAVVLREVLGNPVGLR